MSKAKRPTAQRDMMRKAVRHRNDPCYLCGHPIDYDLPHLDPGAFVVDHVVPLARGGDNALHNAAAAHRVCNQAKSDRLVSELAPSLKPPPEPVEASPIW